jgi:hypothetical protein
MALMESRALAGCVTYALPTSAEMKFVSTYQVFTLPFAVSKSQIDSFVVSLFGRGPPRCQPFKVGLIWPQAFTSAELLTRLLVGRRITGEL